MGGSSKTETVNQNQQTVQTPTTPDYVQDPVKNYYAGINNYQQSDPYSFTTPTNALQNSAYQKTSGLFGANDLYGAAGNVAQGVLGSTPQTNLAGYNSAQTGLLGNAAQTSSVGYQAPSLGTAAQAAATGYQAPTLGNAAQANLQGYQTGTLGNAAQAAGANLGANATTATAASLLDNLDAYRNPAQQQLVDTTLAGFDDNAARARAAQQAQQARSGAFGGSRSAIQSAQLEGDLARERALTQANLNTQAWNAATQLSGQDAANRQQTGLFNANAQNQRDETRAGLDAQNNQFNANAKNQFGLAQFDAGNQAAQFGANAANTGALANQTAQNQFALTGSGLLADAGQFNANAANNIALSNQQATNQYGLAQGQMAADAAQFGANAQNTAGLANMQAQNQFGLANFDAQNQNNQFNAGQANAANQFNAGQLNSMEMQNRAQQLQGAGLLGDLGTAYGNNYRADLDSLLNSGNALYNIQDYYNKAPLTQLQQVGNLLSPGLIQTLSSQTSTGSTSGVNQTKQSGGLLNGLLGVASLGAQLIPSDRRLKHKVELVEVLPDGLGIYDYEYLGTDEKFRGVMSDEVAILRPWALGPKMLGYDTVNYDMLEAA